jgi:hypothetical protein
MNPYAKEMLRRICWPLFAVHGEKDSYFSTGARNVFDGAY